MPITPRKCANQSIIIVRKSARITNPTPASFNTLLLENRIEPFFRLGKKEKIVE